MASVQVLVTGADGQLGHELRSTCALGGTVQFCSRIELDITDAAQVQDVLQRAKPDVVINTAAYTAVDRAESESEQAFAVNARGTENLAKACRANRARLVHVSTDFVFDGMQSFPYSPRDMPNPLGAYGRSKLAGERAISTILGQHGLVVRTSWLYSVHGRNFVKSMLQRMRDTVELGVVVDQVGTPTWARGLASFIWYVARRPPSNEILQWADGGVASWYDFAIAIQELGRKHGLLTKEVEVTPIFSSAYPTAAKRPHYSVLDHSASYALLGERPKHWREQLSRMLESMAGVKGTSAA